MQTHTITRQMLDESDMQNENSHVLTVVDAHLKSVGMPEYSALVELLNDVARHGLSFDIGSAYIRRSYIDKQAELCARIKQVNDAVA